MPGPEDSHKRPYAGRPRAAHVRPLQGGENRRGGFHIRPRGVGDAAPLQLREERARPHGNAKNKKAHLCHKTKMRLARLVYQPLQPCSSQSPATAGSTILVGSILPSGVRDAST